MKRIAAILLLAAAAVAGDDLEARLRAGLLRVWVTTQGWDITSPWNKNKERTTGVRGVVIEPGLILTPASSVRNVVMVQVSVAGSARKYGAKVRHVDLRANLALIEISDAELAAALQPLEFGEPLKLNDEFDIWQLASDDTPERSTGRVVRADATPSSLVLQVKTTCADPGNGQVAVRGGKVVGLLIQTNPSRQEGTVLSLDTIRLYLNDHKDGRYQGLPGGGMWTQTLLRADLRLSYGLGADQHGIAIQRVIPGRSGDGVIQPGDVVLSADGYALDDEGKFVHEVYGRLPASYLFQGRRYAGEKIPVRVLRAGKPMDLSVELRAWPVSEQRVPASPPHGRPEYLVIGGLVVLELNNEAASEIERSQAGVILRRYRDREAWDPPDGRRRIVYVDRVLADDSNKGAEEMADAVIASVNGRRITEIADVVAALEKPEGGFHIFRFEGVECDFAIEAARLAEIDARIAASYRIPQLRFLADKEKEQE